jgi:hypothetical protein
VRVVSIELMVLGGGAIVMARGVSADAGVTLVLWGLECDTFGSWDVAAMS